MAANVTTICDYTERRRLGNAPATIHLQVPRAAAAEAVCGKVGPDDELTMDQRAVTCRSCQLSLLEVA